MEIPIDTLKGHIQLLVAKLMQNKSKTEIEEKFLNVSNMLLEELNSDFQDPDLVEAYIKIIENLSYKILMKEAKKDRGFIGSIDDVVFTMEGKIVYYKVSVIDMQKDLHDKIKHDSEKPKLFIKY